MSALVGQTLGQYRLEDVTGHGGLVNTYRGLHLVTERQATLAVVHANLAADPAFLERFRRETEGLARLRHPHLVPVREVVCDPQAAYMVMEYSPGGTLEARLALYAAQRERPHLEDALNWIEALADAADFVHVNGWFFGGLTPANVFFRRNGEVALGGLWPRRLPATALGLEAAPASARAYLAPEQARGQAGDARSDIYALGAIVCELLTGQPPARGDASNFVVQGGPGRAASRLAPGVEAVLARALATNPAERYQSARAMVRALRAAVAGAQSGSLPLAAARDTWQVDRQAAAPAPVLAWAGAQAASPAVAVRRRQQPLSLTFLALGLLLVPVALGWWAVERSSQMRNVPDAPPRFAAGSPVRVSVPGSASASALRGCPSEFWQGVVGLVSDGDEARVLERQACNGQWWYRIALTDNEDDRWDGEGWVNGRYLDPR